MPRLRRLLSLSLAVLPATAVASGASQPAVFESTCGDGVLDDAVQLQGLLYGPLSQPHLDAIAAHRFDPDGGLNGLSFEDHEACDDGNSKSGDGCSATCGIEPAFVCDDQRLVPAALDVDAPTGSTAFIGLAPGTLAQVKLGESGAHIGLAGAFPASFLSMDLPVSHHRLAFEIQPIIGVNGLLEHVPSIGFALGYQSGELEAGAEDTDFLLVHWPGDSFADGVLPTRPKGLRMTRIQAPLSGAELWVPQDHGATWVSETHGDARFLSEEYGPSLHFEVDASPERVRVWVEGTLALDVTAPACAPFPVDGFALHVYSQLGADAWLDPNLVPSACRPSDTDADADGVTDFLEIYEYASDPSTQTPTTTASQTVKRPHSAPTSTTLTQTATGSPTTKKPHASEPTPSAPIPMQTASATSTRPSSMAPTRGAPTPTVTACPTPVSSTSPPTAPPETLTATASQTATRCSSTAPTPTFKTPTATAFTTARRWRAQARIPPSQTPTATASTTASS